jgi:hypothetical protein
MFNQLLKETEKVTEPKAAPVKESNMGYVRFENTLRDLQDCYDHMDDDLDGTEAEYRKELVDLCKDIVRGYGELEESFEKKKE